MPKDSDTTTFKIGQAASALGLEPYVLRYWETEFPQLQPRRKPSGQRYYLSEDLELLSRIKRLLYDEKMTIEGARRRLEQSERLQTILGEIRDDLLDVLHVLRDCR
ncbi:MAG: MerR family transcriptional regulator [Deltaproteobacteria bacterium]|nr:MerR family transcriptional regulator [Deltaproteobacteria bacterium]